MADRDTPADPPVTQTVVETPAVDIVDTTNRPGLQVLRVMNRKMIERNIFTS